MKKGDVTINYYNPGSTSTHLITHYSTDKCFIFDSPEITLKPSLKETYEATLNDTPVST